MAGGTPPPANGREVNRWLDEGGAPFGRAFSRDGFHWIEWKGLGVFAFSTKLPREVWVWPAANVSQHTLVATFGRLLQPIVLQALGWQAFHAGATACPQGVLAFSGKSGSGKSTISFAMQQLGWRQVADDIVVLRFKGTSINACPLDFLPRLREASRTHFANFPINLPSSPLPDTLPLAAVFHLQQNERLTDPEISLIPQARAFSDLLAHAHCFDSEDPDQVRRLVDNYLLLAARVPVFRLEYRANLQDLNKLIEIIAQTASKLKSTSGADEVRGPNSLTGSF